MPELPWIEMASPSEARFKVNRLRWRLRGAWTWPTFALVTLAEALIMHALPPIGTGIRVVPALILAAAANLFLVAVAAPYLQRRLARRPQMAGAPPAEVVLDRLATGVLLAGVLGLVAAGLAARPLVVSETEETEENASLVRAWVLTNAGEEYKRNLGSANLIRLADGSFRTCVSADDRSRALCLFVDVNREPPLVRRDQSTEPNAEWLGRGGTP